MAEEVDQRSISPRGRVQVPVRLVVEDERTALGVRRIGDAGVEAAVVRAQAIESREEPDARDHADENDGQGDVLGFVQHGLSPISAPCRASKSRSSIR